MLRRSQCLEIQQHWDALLDEQKSTADTGWCASAELPGVWYHPQTEEFAVDPDGGTDRSSVITLNWRRIDPMAGITPITNGRWKASEGGGWLYPVVLPDDTVAFWFAEKQVDMRDLVFSGVIKTSNGEWAIAAGKGLSEECIDRYFPGDDDPVEQSTSQPESTSPERLLQIFDRVTEEFPLELIRPKNKAWFIVRVRHSVPE